MNNLHVALCLILLIGCQFDRKTDQSSLEIFAHEDWYKNGKLKSKVWYNNEMRADSLGLWFYENGNLEVKACFENGKQVGSTTYYYPNGNVKSYYYYNKEGDGSARFGQKYSETGELIEEKGMPIGMIYENGLTIKAENYLDFTVVPVSPPNTDITIHTFSKENTPDFVLGTSYKVKDKMPFFRHYFETKGEYPMRVVSELNDTVRNVIRRDTINFTVTVD